MSDNILHNYANYTYLVELWACSAGTFNSGSGEGDEILIADGGLAGKGQIFDVDYGLDNIEIETIIGGVTKRGFAANAIKINFDIIEPYTVTLLNRLKKVAEKHTDGGDIKATIYLFKIKFVGYNEGGGPPVSIPGANKHIYFNIINLNFKITNRGAIYHCEAIPTSNLSMIPQLDNMIPQHLELKGKTINELFGVGATDPDSKNLKNALNEWEKFKVENKIQIEKNKFDFKFEDGIGDAKIIDPKNIQTPISAIPGSNVEKDMQKGRDGTLEIDTEKGIVKAHAGTRIVDFISNIIQSTNYMTDQVDKGGGPVKLWKVYPRVKIQKYDKATSFITREITFETKAFEYHGLDHPNFGQAPPSSIVKEYDYIFTGLNKDVIKADLDFHMVYFDSRIAKKPLTMTDNKNPAEDATEEEVTDETKAKDVPVTSIKNGVTSIGPQQTTAANTNDKKVLAVGELMSQLLDNGVDLLSLNMEIVGDPDWILQEKPDKIDFEKGDVNFKFNFIAPTKDYKDNGLFDVGGDPAFFSGTYKVITAKSTFRKGKFTQVLTNVRCRIQ